MPNVAWYATAFVLGIVAGLVLGAMRWRSALEAARHETEWYKSLLAMEKDLTRAQLAEKWYEMALAGDAPALDWLGASAGLLTLFNQPAFTTVESRRRAGELYHEARRRLASREPAP